MDILTLDFETFYSDEYTLKKLTTEAYVRDERFETLLCGVRLPYGDRDWLSHTEFARWAKLVDWSRTAVLCHHAQFDGLILSHVYGVRPALWLDTLSMGRLLHGNHISVSLASLAAHYGLGTKSLDYGAFKGKRWSDLTSGEQEALGAGCLQDVELTWRLFQRMMHGAGPEAGGDGAATAHPGGQAAHLAEGAGTAPLARLHAQPGPSARLDGGRAGAHSPRPFSTEELGVIDLTIRLFTEPTLVGDRHLFERVRDEEWSRKNERLMELGVTTAQLQSSAQFVALLEAEGVEVETKPGATGPIPAIAKTDEFMKELLAGMDRAAELAQARLDVRSTIDETRAGRLAAMAARGPVPVYLGYCAAHTLRWGGGDKVNFQNLKRGGELRKGLAAPAGHLLAVVDLSQIECRVLNRVAGQTDVLDRFGRNEDVYSSLASSIFGRPISKADKLERFVGKTAELGCGYGMGGDKFVTTCKRGEGGVELAPHEGKHAVDTYRRTHPEVVRLWREGDAMLRLLSHGEHPFTWRDVVEVERGRITGPNGTSMLYRLDWSEEYGSWRRRTRTGYRSVWGGGLVENVVQYLSRLIMSQAMLRIRAAAPELRLVMTTHDEVVYVVPAPVAEDALALIVRELTRQPSWLPPIPLAAEGTLSGVYEK